MWFDVWEVFLYTFFVYGVVSFVSEFFRERQLIHRNKDICLVNVLFVKDQQDNIEAVVKDILRQSRGKLIIIDRGSTDDTWTILEKLQVNNDYIEIAKEGEKEGIAFSANS